MKIKVGDIAKLGENKKGEIKAFYEIANREFAIIYEIGTEYGVAIRVDKVVLDEEYLKTRQFDEYIEEMLDE